MGSRRLAVVVEVGVYLQIYTTPLKRTSTEEGCGAQPLYCVLNLPHREELHTILPHAGLAKLIEDTILDFVHGEGMLQ